MEPEEAVKAYFEKVSAMTFEELLGEMARVGGALADKAKRNMPGQLHIDFVEEVRRMQTLCVLLEQASGDFETREAPQ